MSTNNVAEQTQKLWRAASRKLRAFRNKPPQAQESVGQNLAPPVIAEIPGGNGGNTGRFWRFIEWWRRTSPTAYIKFGGGAVVASMTVHEISSLGNSEFKARSRLTLEEMTKLEKFLATDLESMGLDKLDVIEAERMFYKAKIAYKALGSQFVGHKHKMSFKRAVLRQEEAKCIEQTTSLERGLSDLNSVIDGRAFEPETFKKTFSDKCRMLSDVFDDLASAARTTPALQEAQERFNERERMRQLNRLRTRSDPGTAGALSKFKAPSPCEETLFTHLSIPFFHYLYELSVYFF